MIDLESVLRNLLGHGTETVAISLSTLRGNSYDMLLLRVPIAPGEFVTFHLKGNTVQPPPQGAKVVGWDNALYGEF